MLTRQSGRADVTLDGAAHSTRDLDKIRVNLRTIARDERGRMQKPWQEEGDDAGTGTGTRSVADWRGVWDDFLGGGTRPSRDLRPRGTRSTENAPTAGPPPYTIFRIVPSGVRPPWRVRDGSVRSGRSAAADALGFRQRLSSRGSRSAHTPMGGSATRRIHATLPRDPTPKPTDRERPSCPELLTAAAAATCFDHCAV
jgi:hypothetical protein